MSEENPDIIEDGHIDIAHPIARKWAKYRLSGEEWQVLWVIMEKTWGWHKSWDKISIKQFYELTEIKKPSIIRAIKKLISKNIVSKRANKNIPSYHINSHFKKWKSVSKKANVSNIVNGVSKRANGVSKKANFQSPKPSPELKQRDPKETLTKETLTKETILQNQQHSKQEKELNQQLDEILVNYQKKFPEQKKIYGLGGIIRVREYFEGIMMKGIEKQKILDAIEKSASAKPWDIISLKIEKESPAKRQLRKIKETEAKKND